MGADEPAAKKAKTEGESYYKVIDGQKYDRALLESVEKFAADGQVGYPEAKKLWTEAEDGKGVTDIEKGTLEYAMKTYKFTEKATTFIKTYLEVGVHKSYYKVIDGVKYDRLLLEEAMVDVADGQVSWKEAKNLFQDAKDGAGLTGTEKDTLEYILKTMKFTDKARAYLENQLKGPSPKSYYKIIDGAKYDNALLLECEDLAKDGVVSEAEAKRMYEGAKDGPKALTEVEVATLKYALGKFNFSEPAKTFLTKSLEGAQLEQHIQLSAKCLLALKSNQRPSSRKRLATWLKHRSCLQLALPLRQGPVALAAAMLPLLHENPRLQQAVSPFTECSVQTPSAPVEEKPEATEEQATKRPRVEPAQLEGVASEAAARTVKRLRHLKDFSSWTLSARLAWLQSHSESSVSVEVQTLIDHLASRGLITETGDKITYNEDAMRAVPHEKLAATPAVLQQCIVQIKLGEGLLCAERVKKVDSAGLPTLSKEWVHKALQCESAKSKGITAGQVQLVKAKIVKDGAGAQTDILNRKKKLKCSKLCIVVRIAAEAESTSVFGSQLYEVVVASIRKEYSPIQLQLGSLNSSFMSQKDSIRQVEGILNCQLEVVCYAGQDAPDLALKKPILKSLKAVTFLQQQRREPQERLEPQDPQVQQQKSKDGVKVRLTEAMENVKLLITFTGNTDLSEQNAIHEILVLMTSSTPSLTCQHTALMSQDVKQTCFYLSQSHRLPQPLTYFSLVIDKGDASRLLVWPGFTTLQQFCVQNACTDKDKGNDTGKGKHKGKGKGNEEGKGTGTVKGKGKGYGEEGSLSDDHSDENRSRSRSRSRSSGESDYMIDRRRDIKNPWNSVVELLTRFRTMISNMPRLLADVREKSREDQEGAKNKEKKGKGKNKEASPSAQLLEKAIIEGTWSSKFDSEAPVASNAAAPASDLSSDKIGRSAQDAGQVNVKQSSGTDMDISDTGASSQAPEKRDDQATEPEAERDAKRQKTE